MRVERWIPINDGEWNESALRAKLERAEYADLTPYAFPAGSFLPPHAHLEDHAEAVLEGEMRVRAGSWEEVLERGDVLHIPRETVHTVQALGSGPLKVLDGSRPHRPARRVGFRLVFLAVLLVLLNFWSARHLGIRLQDFLLVNAVVVLVPQLLRFLDPLEEKSVQGFLRRAFAYLVSTPSLVLLSLGVAATSFFSTVKIVPAVPFPTTEVTVSAADPAVRWLEPGSSPIKLEDQPVTVVKRVFPAGRRVKINAERYFEPEGRLVLQPWVQRTVELKSLPSVRLRIPADRIVAGRLEISRKSDGKVISRAVLREGTGSVVLGSEPRGFDEGRWHDEAGADTRAVEQWNTIGTPEAPAAESFFAEGVLTARFYLDSTDICVARADFSPSAMQVQDVLLEKWDKGTPCD